MGKVSDTISQIEIFIATVSATRLCVRMVSATRHGKRAEGTTLVSIPCSKALKAELAAFAERDHRTLAAWCRMKLQDLARRSRAARKSRAA